MVGSSVIDDRSLTQAIDVIDNVLKLPNLKKARFGKKRLTDI
jgi:hypothetical protein